MVAINHVTLTIYVSKWPEFTPRVGTMYFDVRHPSVLLLIVHPASEQTALTMYPPWMKFYRLWIEDVGGLLRSLTPSRHARKRKSHIVRLASRNILRMLSVRAAHEFC